ASMRHQLSARLRDIVDQCEQRDGLSPELIAFPSARGVSAILPVTLTVTALASPRGDARLAEVMLTLAQQDPTSVPVAVADTMGIRTVATREATESMVETARELFG